MSNPPEPQHADLVTISERSGFLRTGRYDEVEALCPAFERAFPGKVRCFQFGTSPEGRPMLALAASADGTLDAAAARRERRPVVLFQGGIHAGEIDGKDAGFLALREMLTGSAAAGALQRLTLVFVPVFSVDGHERFARFNRPNQVGPEEMGWRTTAQNLNLNRDYVKAEAPEMQAMLGLLDDWDPILYGDLHVTDGADFQHDISILVDPSLSGDPELATAGTKFRDELLAKLDAQGSKSLDFYPSLVKDDDPASGFEVGVMPPRFSNGYWSLRNRFGMLVETHSWKDYPTRVRITRNTIVATLEAAARDGGRWLDLAAAADQRAANLGGQSVPLAFEADDHVSTIDFQGFAYTRELSAISGRILVRYDPSTPQIWRVPLKDRVRPSVTAKAPAGGYIVPAAHATWVGAKLALHGIEYRTIESALGAHPVEAFRASTVQHKAASFEGRPAQTIVGAWQPEARDVPRGSLFVPLAQARAWLILAMLEPTAPDSLAAWGYFANAFERKEYMEAYVAEQVAREMLAKDPELAAEFTRKVATDADFAGDPAARLEFFARLHPSWDERYNLYPVYRCATAP